MYIFSSSQPISTTLYPSCSIAKIKEIGESSNARVTAVEEVLPQSNERQVIVNGSRAAIVSAISKIYRLVVKKKGEDEWK